MSTELTIDSLSEYYGFSPYQNASPHPKRYKSPCILVRHMRLGLRQPAKPVRSREHLLLEDAASIYLSAYKISDAFAFTGEALADMIWAPRLHSSETTTTNDKALPVPTSFSEIAWIHAMLAERQTFKRRFPELLSKYRGAFVALYGGRVVASGTDPDEVHKEALNRVMGSAQQAEQEFPPPILIKKCDESEVKAGVMSLPAVFRGCVHDAQHDDF